MTDLRERFRPAKELPAPDDWGRIAGRVPQPLPEDVGRTRPFVRIEAAAVAVAVSVAAALVLWSSFGGRSTVPLTESPTPSAAPAPSSPTDFEYLYPFFRGSDGWHVHDSGPAQLHDGSVGWAANVAFDPADLGPRAPAIPWYTISALPRDGIVLTALVVPAPSVNRAEAGPWPPGSLDRPLLADAAVRGQEAEEPAGDYTVYEIDGYALIRVYFGSPDPSQEALAAAQAELDTLEVPPTCPVSKEGTFPETMRLTTSTGEAGPTVTAAPGDTVTITGLIPFQREDGSYNRDADSVIELWWDADPAEWIDLVAEPRSTSATFLGSGGTGSCFLSVTITVPSDAAAGDHQIVAIDTDTQRTGAFLYGTAVVHVT